MHVRFSSYIEENIKEVKCIGFLVSQTQGHSITWWQLIIRLDTAQHIMKGAEVPLETKVL